MSASLVGSEMCIRDRRSGESGQPCCTPTRASNDSFLASSTNCLLSMQNFRRNKTCCFKRPMHSEAAHAKPRKAEGKATLKSKKTAAAC
eukprot:1651388-Alexandrium_andersonii.AAC.1